MLFGTKSEKVVRQIEQLELQLEELQAANAVEELQAAAPTERPAAAKPFRRSLPEAVDAGEGWREERTGCAVGNSSRRDGTGSWVP